MINVVGLAELQSVITHNNTREAVRTGLVALAAGQVSAPDELVMDIAPSGDVHIKGAHISSQPWIAFKVATGSFPGASNAGCSFLLDARSGAPRVVIDDGGWLTEMRTAAAGALATDALARQGELTVAVLGAGVQARFQLEALAACRPISEIRVWNRTAERAGTFVASLAADATFRNGGSETQAQIAITAHPTASAAVAGADVIITTTSSREPVLHLADLEPGVHITAMGADTVGKQELEVAILERADVIAVEDLEIASRVGELQHGTHLAGRAITLGSLLTGVAPGRKSDEAITIADLCGIGTHDAAIAGLAADLLELD